MAKSSFTEDLFSAGASESVSVFCFLPKLHSGLFHHNVEEEEEEEEQEEEEEGDLICVYSVILADTFIRKGDLNESRR